MKKEKLVVRVANLLLLDFLLKSRILKTLPFYLDYIGGKALWNVIFLTHPAGYIHMFLMQINNFALLLKIGTLWYFGGIFQGKYFLQLSKENIIYNRWWWYWKLMWRTHSKKKCRHLPNGFPLVGSYSFFWEAIKEICWGGEFFFFLIFYVLFELMNAIRWSFFFT